MYVVCDALCDLSWCCQVLLWLQVVMDKGGAKLDMRGRCSAGQKVEIISCCNFSYTLVIHSLWSFFIMSLGVSLTSDQAGIGRNILPQLWSSNTWWTDY